jgi:hypothetical protein
LGGRDAPGDVLKGATTQVWLAGSEEPSAKVSGRYFYHQQPQSFKPAASRPEVQERLVEYLAQLTGIRLP